MTGRRRSNPRDRARNVEPPQCPHPRCPGCPLFHLPYAEQLETKRRFVDRAFEEHFVSPELACPEIAPTRPSPDALGYRATARLALARERREIRLGVYERGTHDVVDVPWCPVHHPLVAAGVQALRALLAQAPSLVSPRVGALGWLRYAAFQASVLEGKLVVSLVTRSEEGLGVLRSLGSRLVEKVPAISGVVWNLNPSQGNEIFGERWEVLWGDGAIRERLGSLVFRASPSSFLQANRAQAGWVYRSAEGWLAPEPTDVALDLYAGVGGLALHLAPRVSRTVAVEDSRTAAADGEWTARAEGIERVSFQAGRVEEILPRLLADGFAPTLVTLNPPRRGTAASVIDALRSLQVRAILYVSCNPETLARDAALLCCDGRFRLTMLLPVDFFPQTGHVETVALFQGP